MNAIEQNETSIVVNHVFVFRPAIVVPTTRQPQVGIEGTLLSFSVQDPFLEFRQVKSIPKHHTLWRDIEVMVVMDSDPGKVCLVEFILVPLALETIVCFPKALAGPFVNCAMVTFAVLIFLDVLLVEHFQQTGKIALSYPSH